MKHQAVLWVLQERLMFCRGSVASKLKFTLSSRPGYLYDLEVTEAFYRKVVAETAIH